jgi:hypothetical protein
LCEICSISRQEFEKAYKALRLNNGDVSSSYYPIGYGSNDYNSKLLGASNKKPTLWIKRLKFRHSPYNTRLRGASGSGSNSGFDSDSSDHVRPDADGIVRIRGVPLMKIKQWQRQPELEKERAEKALSLNCGF